MKSLKIFSLLLLISGLAQAQGIMNFQEETHDFGTITEGTVVSYEFEFINTGDQPIEITRVQASCGCTSPFWTKEAIMPGKKGNVKASYNSSSRPGPFTKSLTIYSNAKKAVHILYIKGFVEPKSANVKKEGENYNNTTVTKEIPPATIQLDKDSHDFGQIETKEKTSATFQIYNTGQTNLIISKLESACNCVSFNLSAGVIPANGSATLELVVNTDEIKNLDETFTLTSNDPKTPTKTIKLKGEIIENFSSHMFRVKK